MGRVIRIAAAGDIHASEATRSRIAGAFARVEGEADVVLLAGDLTTTGEPEQAAVLADACRDLPIPVFTVLGNHDVHLLRTAKGLRAIKGFGPKRLEKMRKYLTVAKLSTKPDSKTSAKTPSAAKLSP